MRIAVPLAIVVLLALPALALTPEEVEAQARKLEQQFMAPCCGANILAMHDSGSAQAMKREIREMLAAGKTRGEIVDHYVEIHGTTILSMPDDSGFGLTAYLLPGIALIAAGVLMALFLRSRARQTAESAASPEAAAAEAPALDPDYRERVEQAVRDY